MLKAGRSKRNRGVAPSSMDSRSRAIGTPDDLLRHYAEKARVAGVVTKIRFLCTNRQPDSLLCLIEARTNASAVAEAVGGFLFGNTPAVHFGPIPVEFQCGGREDGKVTSTLCDRCQLTIPD